MKEAGRRLGGAGASASLIDSDKINSIGTLRARLGWANAGWLCYVTGGVAWAEVNDTFTGSTTNLRWRSMEYRCRSVKPSPAGRLAQADDFAWPRRTVRRGRRSGAGGSAGLGDRRRLPPPPR
jgi:opacity protein-like surface antigen